MPCLNCSFKSQRSSSEAKQKTVTRHITFILRPSRNFFIPKRLQKAGLSLLQVVTKCYWDLETRKLLGLEIEKNRLVVFDDKRWLFYKFLFYSLTLHLLFRLNLRSLWFFSVCLIHKESFQIGTWRNFQSKLWFHKCTKPFTYFRPYGA